MGDAAKEDLIPKKNNIRLREQEGNLVVFNLETSGFHMLAQDGADLLNEVDGRRTIKDLAALFSERNGVNAQELQEQFIVFFEGLALRKIVDLLPRPAS